jgi:hypothetical protein
MNHTEILKRSWKILWEYKTLWVFGVILALTSGGGGGNGGGSSNFSTDTNRNFNFPGFDRIEPELRRFGEIFENGLSQEFWQTFSIIILCLVCLVLFLAIVFAILRYVSRVALIRMVDELETSGEKVNWRAGFRLGWSKRAFRLFLIDLVITLPLIVIFLFLFGCAFLPVILGAIPDGEPSVASIIATVGLVFLMVFIAIIVGVALSLILQIIWRECVIADLGVFDSIRTGWRLLKRNFKDVFVMWLILVGVQIAFFILSIPVILLLVGIGILIAGVLGVLVFLGGQVVSEAAGAIPAIILGLVIFIAVLSIPLLFLNGLKETYLSTAWTLVYREITMTPRVAAEDELPATTGPASGKDSAELQLPS